MFIDYKFNNLKQVLELSKGKVVLRGAGVLGKLAINALHKLGIKVDYFWELDSRKIGLNYCDVKVVNTEKILELGEKTNIFICSNYFSIIIPELKKLGFKNIFNCYELIKNTDFAKIANSTNKEIHNFGDISDRKPFNHGSIPIDRIIGLHHTGLKTQISQNFRDDSYEKLNIKHIDLVITEQCSMKCIDCSNLMQYYTNPKNSNFDDLKKSINVTMSSIDYLSEFRVIGGEPFMNKDIGKIINFMKTFNNFSHIVIYTNATIIPKNENLKALIDDRVSLDITRYKTNKHSLKNHEKLIQVLNDNGIKFISHTAETWTDSGRVKKYVRTENELKDIFLNCCVGDILSILNGKMYRCPFSANAHNINAIPYAKEDVIDLLDESIDKIHMKEKIKKLYTRKDKKEYLEACKYCKGRDFSTAIIPAGIQTQNILQNPKFSD